MYEKNEKTNRWLKEGATAGDLLKTEYHVMVDAEIIITKEFQLFYSNWIMNNMDNKTLLIQSLKAEAVKISPSWKTMKNFVCNAYEDYETVLQNIGGCWIYITENPQKAESLRDIFKKIKRPMRVYGIDENGNLQNYRPVQRERRVENVFKITNQICPISRILYNSASVPMKRDIVHDSNGCTIRLEDEFISNPQSITYQTNIPEMQAKIYQKSWLQNSYFKNKIETMLSKQVAFDGICWPKDMLYDRNGDFVGILVPKAEGYQLKQDLMSQAGIEKHFPTWSRKDLIHLTKVILEKIVYLQKKNVIFGLINPSAILVKDVDHVYFTDTDTYQIEGYPILAYEKVMQAPELQEEKNGLRLYTKQQDNYEIALLIFMILMPGKFPYNKGKNIDVSKSIKNKMFAFKYGEEQGVEHGAHEYFGLWRFAWSHLGNGLKKAFYFTFQNGQPYSWPEKRKSASFWLIKVNEVEKELENPYDKESLKIFPRTFKRYSGTQTIRCIKCGIAHPSFYYRYPEKKICNSCLGQPSDKHFVCRSCQKTYYYDFSTLFKYEKLVETKNFKMPTHCPYCRSDKERCQGSCKRMVPSYRLNKNGMCPDCAKQIRESVVKRYRCQDCGNWIEITQGQKEFFEQKSMNLPVRCEACRNKRRNRY